MSASPELVRIREQWLMAEKKIAEEPERYRLGSGPCPGSPEPDEFLENGLPHYHPASEWEGVHDWDDAQCWRCNAYDPRYRRRREGFHVSHRLMTEIMGLPGIAEWFQNSEEEAGGNTD